MTTSEQRGRAFLNPRANLLEVAVPSDVSLLEVDAVLTLAAKIRYGLSRDSEPVGEDARTARVAENVRAMREALFRAVETGALVPRDAHGIVIVAKRDAPHKNSLYVDRNEFAEFARQSLRLLVVEGPAYSLMGRYTLDAAAHSAEASRAAAESLLAQLREAASTEELPMYGSSSEIPMQLRHREFIRAYGSAKWSDLNLWLERHWPSTNYRFAQPYDAYHACVALQYCATRGPVSPLPPDWKLKAVEIANEVARSMYDRGERQITARSVASATAVRLGKLDGSKYWGKRGQRSADTVRNEALRAWRFCPPKSTD
jgi:hypothetical protein